MLPPGHIAAGYLTGLALLKFAHPAITPHESQVLLLWSMFFSFAPDLDSFITFAREKAFIITDVKKNDHRGFFTHAPLLWLAVGLLVYFFSTSVFYKYFGLVLWLGSWSHFVLDSVDYWIMWLWPFSKKRCSFKQVSDIIINEKSFIRYWFAFLKYYIKTLTFYLEIILIASAVVVFLNH